MQLLFFYLVSYQLSQIDSTLIFNYLNFCCNTFNHLLLFSFIFYTAIIYFLKHNKSIFFNCFFAKHKVNYSSKYCSAYTTDWYIFSKKNNNKKYSSYKTSVIRYNMCLYQNNYKTYFFIQISTIPSFFMIVKFFF